MENLLDMLPLILAMLATGAFAGVLAGLLGVGGGIVIVPALDIVLGSLQVDPVIRMHIAVATSLAVIIPTSLSSTRSHHRRASVDFALARQWGPFILVGSVAGAWLASRMHSAGMSLVFALVIAFMALRMLLPAGRLALVRRIPAGPLGRLFPLGIGGVSSVMGIGGGTLSVPALSLLGLSMHRAVGTSALFGLLIALPGALAYVWTGWADPRLPPGSLGYVSLPGLLCIAPMTVLTAPLGVALAHRLNAVQLRLFFGGFLLLVALRMLYRALLA